MSEEKHTPKPWEGRYVPSGMPTDCVKFGVIGPDGLEVARVWRQEDVPVVAAAPELLESVIGLLQIEDARISTGAFRPNEAALAIINSARAAVAKTVRC